MSEHWMETFLGYKFDLQDVDINVINAVDIIEALSKLCRFGGHCRTFYSVAEHSCYVYDMLRWFYGSIIKSLQLDKYKICMMALLHDAAEAYIGDIKRPLKQMLGDSIRLIEKEILTNIYHKFDCFVDDDRYKKIIKDVDNMVLMTERRDLMINGIENWELDGLVAPISLDILSLKESRMDWRDAHKEMFIRFDRIRSWRI